MRATLVFAFVSLLTLACSSTSEPPGADAASVDGGADGGAVDAAGDTDAAGDDSGAIDAATIDADVDGGSGPCMAAGACDPFDPTSCPGQACRPSATGASCEDISATPAGEHEACTRAADCTAGLVCLDFADGAGLVCHRMCAEGSVGSCGADEACTGTFGDACVRACRPIPAPCDIYAQDCPEAEDTCTFVRNPETSAPYTGCRPAGTQMEGQACGGGVGSCGHGLVCINDGTMNLCHAVCDPDVTPPTSCPAGQECTGFAMTWMVGFCRMPAP